MNVRWLREQTRAEHEATEAMLPLSGADLRLETYIGCLRAMLPVVESWERWAAEHAPAPLQPLLPVRRRAPLLRRDLRFFGVAEAGTGLYVPVNWEEVVRGPSISRETLSPQAFAAAFLGVLYVMEGSTLGGRYIARHVEGVLQLVPGEGDAYFLGHQEQTGALWRETIAAVEAAPEDESCRVIAAARRAFGAFGEALALAFGETQGHAGTADLRR